MSALVIGNGAREHIFQFQSRSTLHNGEYAIKKPGCMRFCAGRVCSSVTLTRKIDVDVCAHGIWDACMLHARQSQLNMLLNHDRVLCAVCAVCAVCAHTRQMQLGGSVVILYSTNIHIHTYINILTKKTNPVEDFAS